MLERLWSLLQSPERPEVRAVYRPHNTCSSRFIPCWELAGAGDEGLGCSLGTISTQADIRLVQLRTFSAPPPPWNFSRPSEL